MSDFLRDFPDTEDDIPFANDDEARAYMRSLLEPLVQREQQDGQHPETATEAEE